MEQKQLPYSNNSTRGLTFPFERPHTEAPLDHCAHLPLLLRQRLLHFVHQRRLLLLLPPRKRRGLRGGALPLFALPWVSFYLEAGKNTLGKSSRKFHAIFFMAHDHTSAY